MVFSWLRCPDCKKDYVAVPNPAVTSGWFFFKVEHCDWEHPSHFCSGGFLCVHGHPLEILAPAVVLTANGQWLRLAQPELYHQVN